MSSYCISYRGQSGLKINVIQIMVLFHLFFHLCFISFKEIQFVEDCFLGFHSFMQIRLKTWAGEKTHSLQIDAFPEAAYVKSQPLLSLGEINTVVKRSVSISRNFNSSLSVSHPLSISLFVKVIRLNWLFSLRILNFYCCPLLKDRQAIIVSVPRYIFP